VTGARLGYWIGPVWAVAAAFRARATRARAAGSCRLLEAIERHASGLRAMSDLALRTAGREAGVAARADPKQTIDSVARVLAPVSERLIGVLGHAPTIRQILAAYACTRGCWWRWRPGEGKTLAASLAAATIALAGTPVHVLTVNRYL